MTNECVCFRPQIHELRRLSEYLRELNACVTEIEDAGGRPRRVIGIDASATQEKTIDQVTRIANTTAEVIGLGRTIGDHEVIIRSGWQGPAYGIPDESTIEAIRTTGQLEGVILDPVYEGKSMAGLYGLIRSGELTDQNTVLYAHLGGQLALNAYSSILE